MRFSLRAQRTFGRLAPVGAAVVLVVALSLPAGSSPRPAQALADGEVDVAATLETIGSLDGTEVEARPGETIWQVARRRGTTIPHLCYSPEPGYRPDGNCRACMVHVEGERALAASCLRRPTAGMVVRTEAERAIKALQDEGLDVFGSDWQKSTVELRPGGE